MAAGFIAAAAVSAISQVASGYMQADAARSQGQTAQNQAIASARMQRQAAERDAQVLEREASMRRRELELMRQRRDVEKSELERSQKIEQGEREAAAGASGLSVSGQGLGRLLQQGEHHDDFVADVVSRNWANSLMSKMFEAKSFDEDAYVTRFMGAQQAKITMYQGALAKYNADVNANTAIMTGWMSGISSAAQSAATYGMMSGGSAGGGDIGPGRVDMNAMTSGGSQYSFSRYGTGTQTAYNKYWSGVY